MIISRTPFRISFFGGGTDYPAWYRKHGGAVLATTIDKYCYITCRYLPPFFEHKYCLIYSKIEYCQTIDEIVHPAVREVLRYLGIDRGLEIHHDGDLPARSGMGSSSAFTVGLLHALLRAARDGCPASTSSPWRASTSSRTFSRKRSARRTRCWRPTAGSTTSGSCPTASSRSGRSPATQERIRELNSHLMLFYTGIKRTASNVAATYVNDLDERRRQLRL